VGQQDLPPYVIMPAYPGHSEGLRRAGPYGGYLGKQYDPLFSTCEPRFARKGAFYDPVQPTGEPLLSALNPLPEVPPVRLGGRRTLLEQLDRRLSNLSASRAVEGLGAFQRQAFSLLTASKLREAFDLAKEPSRVRDRFGRNLYGS